MTPGEVDRITSQDKALDSPRPLDAAQGSFLQVDQPNVALVTWKMAEDGDGTVLTFRRNRRPSRRRWKCKLPALM